MRIHLPIATHALALLLLTASVSVHAQTTTTNNPPPPTTTAASNPPPIQTSTAAAPPPPVSDTAVPAVSSAVSSVPVVSSSTSSSAPPAQPSQPSGTGTVPSAPLPLTPHGPIQPRFGASAQLLRDQGLILFVGGYGGTWAQSTAAPDGGVVALNVRSAFTVNSNANWITVQQPVVSTQPNESSPLVGAYGVGVVARGGDVNLGYTGDVFHYVFAQLGPRDGAIPGLFPTTTVYEYMPGVGSIFQGYWNSRSPPGRGRQQTASCLIDPQTVIIHGGVDITYGVIQQSTWLLSLTQARSTDKQAWLQPQSSAVDPKLMLKDQMMACAGGKAYMLGGVRGTETDSEWAPLDYMFVFEYANTPSDGKWTRTLLLGPSGFPQNRSMATLTAVSDTQLILHGGYTQDIDGYYQTANDTWMLDLSKPVAQWSPLSPSPMQRHSHNAIFVNDFIIYAFGTYINGTASQAENIQRQPQLIAYDVRNDQWGNFPSSAAYTPTNPPPAMSPHAAPTPPPAPAGPAFTLSQPVIYGIAGGGSALVLIAIITIVWSRHSRKQKQQAEIDHYMTDRLRREDVNPDLALQGILGSHAAPLGREVGGELKKVIEYKQTGVEQQRVSDDSDEAGTTYKFGMKVALNDDSHKLDPKKTFGHRDSYASGFSGLTYPSGSGVSIGDTDEESEEGEEESASELGSQLGSRVGSRSATPLSTNAKNNTPSLVSDARRKRRALIDNLSKRSSTVPVNEPLKPWEMPGMGIINQTPQPFKSTRAPSRALTPNRDVSALQRAYTPNDSNHLAVNAKQSRFSLNSSLDSGESGAHLAAAAANGAPFDESQYMRTLFAQFNDQQILESWNSYVGYTGQVYSIQQIASLRVIYGQPQVPESEESHGSSSNNGGLQSPPSEPAPSSLGGDAK
ncbi:hypothetical protein HDU81_009868 [Chytriomyces hyalinus]|nr:hypothetical protein HDU81_009868 [Chytriomyces hyalinus]